MAGRERRVLLNRYRALLRDEVACQDCGFHNDEARGLEVHHVQPLAQGGEDVLSNMVTLCRTCHAKRHGIEPSEWHNEEKGEALCPECGEQFLVTRPNKRFCKDICRVRAWQKRFPRIDPTTGLPKQAKHTQER